MDDPIVPEMPPVPEPTPYQEFKATAELAFVIAELDRLRQLYIGNDEQKFRMLDSSYQVLNNL